MEHSKLFKDLPDQDLFMANYMIGSEIACRIADLLIKHNITCYTFDKEFEDLPVMSVWDDCETKTVHIISVGLLRDQYKGKVDEYVFVLDEHMHMFCKDDIYIPELWDVYKELKESIV